MPYHLLVIITVFILIWLPASHASSSLTTGSQSTITTRPDHEDTITYSVTQHRSVVTPSSVSSVQVSPTLSNDNNGGSTNSEQLHPILLDVLIFVVTTALTLWVLCICYMIKYRNNTVHPDPAIESERSRHSAAPSPSDVMVNNPPPTRSHSWTESSQYCRRSLDNTGIMSAPQSPVCTMRQHGKRQSRSITPSDELTSVSSLSEYQLKPLSSPPKLHEYDLHDIPSISSSSCPSPDEPASKTPEAGTRRRSTCSCRSSQVEETGLTSVASLTDEVAPSPNDDVLVLEDIKD